MLRQFKIMTAILAMALLIAGSGLSYAEVNIPKTAINGILAHQNGLELTEAQVKKLDKFNKDIIEKMIQVKARVDIRKLEVDKLSGDWTKVHGMATDRLINEYYDLLAKLKQLELEAIMKAKGVLTVEQMRHYAELVSIEAMMIKLDSDYFVSY